MTTLRGIAIVCACAALAALLYWKLNPPGPDVIDERLAEVRAASADAVRIEITEPITLDHVPRAGDSWTQTTLMQGRAEQSTAGDGRAYDMDIHLTSEARVSDGSNPGEIVIDHAITHAALNFSNPTWPEEIQRSLADSLRERESNLLQAQIRETLSAGGERIGIEIDVPNTTPELALGAELLVASLFESPPAVGQADLAAGSTWSRTEELPSIPGIPIRDESTLDHIEARGAERVAVVLSERNAEFLADGVQPIYVGSVTEPTKGTAEFLIEHLSYTWQGEDRHRLSDGRRIQTTGHSHRIVDYRIISNEVTGRGFVLELNTVQDLDVTCSIEYHP